MKKTTLYLMVMVLSLSTFSSVIYATEKTPTPLTKPTEIPADVKIQLDRLEEIKGMDKSEMSTIERKELRIESRNIKAELRSTGNGVYISAGAVVLILLLIIIL